MANDGDRLAAFWHPAVLDHDTGRGAFDRVASDLLEVEEAHVEGPDRLRNMLSILKRGPLAAALKGSDWTTGGIAVSNEDIEEIWNLVIDGTPVVVRP